MLQAEADMRAGYANGGLPACCRTACCRTACGRPDAGRLRSGLEHNLFMSSQTSTAPDTARPGRRSVEARDQASRGSPFPRPIEARHPRAPTGLAMTDAGRRQGWCRCAPSRWAPGHAPGRDAGGLRLPDRPGDDGTQSRRQAATCAVVGACPLRVPFQRHCCGASAAGRTRDRTPWRGRKGRAPGWDARSGPWPEHVRPASGCPRGGKSSRQ